MVLFIAGDIGGTNSRLQLLRASKAIGGDAFEKGKGEVVVGEETYASTKYDTLQEVIEIFLKKYKPASEQVYCMCLAVAGPVTNNAAKITNLAWVIDGAALAAYFRLESVSIINDFVGIGYGLLALEDSDLELVHGAAGGAVPPPKGVKAVIGAGTGLGECFLTHSGSAYEVFPAEGGHTDFSPRNKMEFQIMEHIKKTADIDRVSVERVSSGLGLPKIYDFLLTHRGDTKANPVAAALIKGGKEDVGRVIAQYAQSGQCPLCVETMDIFTSCYGAEAGNLCLKLLPFGGLYIAGGIAAKNMHVMRKNNQFVTNFLDKGRMRTVLERIPIYLITHPQVGLLGSKVICRRTVHANARPLSKL